MSIHSDIKAVRIESITSLAKILSDPTRVKILTVLSKTDGMCVNEIADEVAASPSATSHQLSKLESKGIVECFREGQKMCYELKDDSQSKKLIQMLKTL